MEGLEAAAAYAIIWVPVVCVVFVLLVIGRDVCLAIAMHYKIKKDVQINTRQHRAEPEDQNASK